MDEELLVESLFGVKKEKLIKQASWNDISNLQTSFENKDDFDVKKTKRKREIELKPAWEDEDDEKLIVNTHKKQITRKLTRDKRNKVITGKEFSEKLHKQFEKINNKPTWAELPSEEGDAFQDSVSKLLLSSESLVDKQSSSSSSSSLLPNGTINIRFLQYANHQRYTKGIVTSVRFHPNSQLMLVSGHDGNLNFFNINGEDNPHIHTVSFAKTPIYSAFFNPLGSNVIASCRRSYFFVHDLSSTTTREIFPQKAFFTSLSHTVVKGYKGGANELRGATVDGSRREKSLERLVVPKYNNGSDIFAFLGSSGYIHLASLSSFTFVSSFKLANEICSLSFSPINPHSFFALNDNGFLYHLDLRMTGNIVASHDISATIGAGTRVVDVAPNGEWLAVGSNTGNVGLYSIKESMKVVNTYIQSCSSLLSSSSSSSSYSIPSPSLPPVIAGSSFSSSSSSSSSPSPSFIPPSLIHDFSNLRTSISLLEFNNTSEILAIATDAISSSSGSPPLRLIHTNTHSVFTNWPTPFTPLKKISCGSFSSSSGEYFSVGNIRGKVLLYRLNHYKVG